MRIFALLLLSGSLAFGQAFTFGDVAFLARLSGGGGGGYSPGSTNLVALWHFDHSGTAINIAESVASNNAAIAFGNTNNFSVSGVITNGLNTASDGFTGQIVGWQPFTNFSISWWGKYTNSDDVKIIFGRDWDGPEQSYVVCANISGGLFVVTALSRGHLDTSLPLYTDGVWRHYAITYNPATAAAVVYLNGAVYETLGWGEPGPFEVSTSANYCIGTSMIGDWPLADSVDDLAIFDSVLSPARVAEIYSNGTNGIPINP